jgi:uncharacterized membrane protein
LTVFDIKNDSALYSVRALGWFDYLGGGQTAPVQWFGKIPSWSLLSFHDCPPLVFAIQKIFFILFGDNIFAARLPFALAGVLSVAVIYYAVRYFKGQRTALWSALIFCVSSYAAWASRSGYLEGIEILFISLSLLFFIKYLVQNKINDLYWWSFIAGLAFMSKYTSAFLLPVGFLFLIIFEYGDFKNIWKKILYPTLIFLGTISPILVYNILVFKYRGHFDASLSAMVGMHPQDYSIIAARVVNVSIFDNFKSLLECFYGSISAPIFIFFLIALVYLVIKAVVKRESKVELFILLNILAVSVMFCFGVPATRQVSIFMPLISIVLAIFIEDSNTFLIKNKRFILSKLFLLVIILILFLEFLYCLNTNILIKPIGNQVWFFSGQRLQSDGWNELDDYWRDNLLPVLPKKKKISNLEGMSLNSSDFFNKNVIFYDDSVNWFAYMWYIEKYPLYYRLPFLPVSVLFTEPNLIETLKSFGAKDFYYVSNYSPKVIDATVSKNIELMDAISQLNLQLEQMNIEPKEIISREGETAFKIYKLPY